MSGEFRAGERVLVVDNKKRRNLEIGRAHV